MPPPHGASRRSCAPVPNPIWGRGLSEQSEFRSPTVGTGAKASKGPRPGAHGFGSFCRNKRTASRGAETPQELLPLLSSPTFVIGDPAPFSFLAKSQRLYSPVNVRLWGHKRLFIAPPSHPLSHNHHGGYNAIIPHARPGPKSWGRSMSRKGHTPFQPSIFCRI